MKTRYMMGVMAGLVICQLPMALAFQPPAAGHEPLPNYDKRKTAASSTVAARPEQRQAAAALKATTPRLVLDRDARTGTPRWLAAGRGFLTGPVGSNRGLSRTALNAVSVNDPHRVIKAYVNENSALFGHDASLLDDAQLKIDTLTAHSGTRSVVWQQQLDEIPVYGGLFVGHLSQNQELVSVSDRFVPNLRAAATAIPARNSLIGAPPVTARQAVQAAASHLGGSATAGSLQLREAAPQGAIQRQSFGADQLRGDAHAQLVWLPMNDSSLALCWQTILTTRARPEMYLVLVDARSGEIMLRRNLTANISDATYNVYTSDSPSPFSPGLDTPSSFQPPVVSRTVVTLKALNTNASPAGWINDGVNETRGNNVDAHLDRNDDDLPDLPRTQGSPNRNFNFPLDLSLSPTSYGDAAVVNLFYWNNFAHDKLYELGFTEAFGNFQGTNFGRGGFGGDAVMADGQDGGGFNNANFSTPPDGYPGRMQMYIFDGPTPDRDGDLDSEVMLHEYTHGLSNRLLGGGDGIFNLQPAGMGEGWSDFYAMCLLSEPTDDPHANYATGGYATRNFYGLSANYYFGIRRYPYSTDMNKNPLTLKDIDPTQADPHAGIPISPVIGGSPADEVHAMGEVWCMALWEARANLVDKLGGALGNQTILRLVTDGLKLSPANASFLEARDGILLADELLTGGDNAAELWYAFAKRGMGYSATVPPSDTDSTIGVQEAYDVPDYVNVGPPDGILEIKITPPTGAALFGATTNAIYVRVTDGAPVTNATISASLSLGGSLAFTNNGVAPDLTANNAIYSANFVTPNLLTNVTVTFIISAPGKDSATNIVNYAIVPIPANDNFTNATKVPASGAAYVTNNKRATMEPGEPTHAGVASVAGSLWWNFTPTNNATVLLDTAGSGVNNLLAVYTNSTLATLKEVISANDVNGRPQPFLFLNAKSGITYRIAVASYDTNNLGTIRLAIVPGGVPDTNAPTVTVISPPSGLTLATNRLVITGSAVDPDPNPSGLQGIQFRITRGLANQANENDGGGAGGTVGASLISTNWSSSVGLWEGLNFIEVTVRDNAGNVSAPVVLQATYRPQDPANDIFANAIQLSGTAGTNSINTLKGTKEVGEPNHANNPGGKSVWWKIQPDFDGVLTLSTTNSTFDTLLAVYRGTAVNALNLVANNDDAPGAVGGYSKLSLAVRSNQVYRIALDGYDGAGGAAFLQFTLVPATIYQLTVNNSPGGTTYPGTIDVESGASVQVNAYPSPGYSFDIWEGDVVSFANPVTVVVNGNRTITPRFRAQIATDGFESGNLSGLGWSTSGGLPWIVQSGSVGGGNFAARSATNITHSQTSSLFLNGNYRAGNVSFQYRVSSEEGWDWFGVYLDGVLQQQWSGEFAWTSYSFPVSAGNHTVEWRYSKDQNNSAGLDAAFLDGVDVPLAVPVNGTSPAQLLARRLSDGTVFIDVTGQVNQQYVVQTSTDLVNWQNYSTNVAVGGFFRVTDSASLTTPTRFYRAVVLP